MKKIFTFVFLLVASYIFSNEYTTVVKYIYRYVDLTTKKYVYSVEDELTLGYEINGVGYNNFSLSSQMFGVISVIGGDYGHISANQSAALYNSLLYGSGRLKTFTGDSIIVNVLNSCGKEAFAFKGNVGFENNTIRLISHTNTDSNVDGIIFYFKPTSESLVEIFIPNQSKYEDYCILFNTLTIEDVQEALQNLYTPD